MRKYDSLTPWLAAQTERRFKATLREIDAIVGGLPPSARSNRTWWGNSRRQPHAAAWIDAGWVIDKVDFNAGAVWFERGAPVERGGQSRSTPIADGRAALERMITAAGWSTLGHAVAAHTTFLHPLTVAQTEGAAMAPIVRDMHRRGELGALPSGQRVLFDDNATPTDVFLWAAQRTKGTDVQFNHVWTCSEDPDAYTALWNLCCTPAFLAKTTDTHPEVTALLAYRAWDLYGYRPAGTTEPERPDGYESYEWAAMPPGVANLERLFRARMARAPKRRICTAAREIGWLFSDGPDATV